MEQRHEVVRIRSDRGPRCGDLRPWLQPLPIGVPAGSRITAGTPRPFRIHRVPVYKRLELQEGHPLMLVLTPQRRLAFITSHAPDVSRVLVLETFSEQVIHTRELRPLSPAAARP
jgi:hypothetical protein